MKKYPLLRLLALREHRAETAKREVSRQRRLLAEALAAAKEAEQVAKEFALRRPQEEAALFESIKNQVLERKDLDSYHEDLAALAAKELQLFEMAEQAKAKVKQLERDLAQAVEAYQQAMREVRKFEEHRAIWWQAESLRRENLEELEAEEVAGIAATRRKQ